ncbi:MAG TPA: hypothetical protein VG840_07090, partial [Casimicrobiaceae bacterium]|nr:hypothetical protein [Casimicrobiaceae bacterium]
DDAADVRVRVEGAERVVDLARNVVVERIHPLRAVDAHEAYALARLDQQVIGHDSSLEEKRADGGEGADA